MEPVKRKYDDFALVKPLWILRPAVRGSFFMSEILMRNLLPCSMVYIPLKMTELLFRYTITSAL